MILDRYILVIQDRYIYSLQLIRNKDPLVVFKKSLKKFFQKICQNQSYYDIL